MTKLTEDMADMWELHYCARNVVSAVVKSCLLRHGPVT